MVDILQNYANQVKEDLLDSLQDYMKSVGIDFKGAGNGMFSCPNIINHKNGDKNFSGSFNMKNGRHVWYCHTCKQGGDLFNISNIVEGLPISTNRDLYSVTIPSIAETIGYIIDLPKYYKSLEDIGLNSKNLPKRTPKAIREQIDEVIMSRKSPDKINEDFNRKYPQDIKESLSDEFDIFFPTRNDFSFIPDFPDDLNQDDAVVYPAMNFKDDGVINDNNMVFPIYDQYNDLISFCARRNKTLIENGHSKYKYTKTKEGAQPNIFNTYKALRHIKAEKHIFCFESQLDAMVAYISGLKNSIAIGTGFNPSKLIDYFRDNDVKEIIVCLDSDKAGIDASVKAYDAFTTHGFVVSFVILPPGMDADEYIIKDGIELFTNYQNRISVVQYILDNKYGNIGNESLSTEARYIAALEYIIQYSRNSAVAIGYADTVSKMFDIKSITDIEIDISREMATKKDPIVKRMNTMVEDLSLKIKDEPDIQKKVNLIETMYNESQSFYKNVASSAATEKIKELDNLLEQVTDKDRIRILTGIPDIDEIFGLTPGTLAVIGAKPSIGKSTLMRAIACAASARDDDLMVIHCSLDDSITDTMDGIISNIAQVSNEVIESGVMNERQIESISRAKLIVREWWKDGRYYLFGQDKIQTINDIRTMLKSIQLQVGDRKKLFILDNMMNIPEVANYSGANKRPIVESAINAVHTLTQSIPNMATFNMVEVVKTAEDTRITLNDLKETATIEFRAKVIGLLQNEFKAKRGETDLYWVDSQNEGTRKPILEINMPKKKTGMPNRDIFLKMDPAINTFHPCTPQEVSRFKKYLTKGNKDETSYDDGGDGEF